MSRPLTGLLSGLVKLLGIVIGVGLLMLLADFLPETPDEADAATEGRRRVPLYDITLAPDGRQYAAITMNYRLVAGDLDDATFPEPLDPLGEPVKWAEYSPSGDGLLVGLADGTVVRRDSEGEDHPLGRLPGTVWRLAVSRDGRRLAGLSIHPSEIHVWDVATGDRLCRLRGFPSDANAVGFSGDGRLVLTHHWDGTLGLWDAQSGRRVRTITGDASGVGCVLGSPDGRSIASGDSNGWVRLRDLQTGKLRWKTASGRLYMKALAFSPDGRLLACGGYLGRVTMIDAATGAVLSEVEAHQSAITGIAFSPDGQRLVSVGEDGALRVWSAPDLEPLNHIQTPVHQPDDEDE